jgi:myosin heavy subunit
MELKIEIRDVPVKDIVFDPENPNWHSEEEVKAVAKSINELFRLHDPIGYYDDGKCKLICGELRVRAEIQNGASVIKGMKVLLEKPTERFIRELQAVENIQRRLDWVSRGETYLKLREIGLSSKEIHEMIGVDTEVSIRELARIARLLRKVSPEIVERLRRENAYWGVAKAIVSVLGTRVKIGAFPGRYVEAIPDEDASIAEAAFQKLLQGEIEPEEVREFVLEQKVGSLEKLREKEAEERESELQKLLREREQRLKIELQKQQETAFAQREQELEAHYQQLLQDKETIIKALEERLQKLDKKETKAITQLRKRLEEERKARKALLEELEQERKNIQQELEDEFADRLEWLIKAERKKIHQQVEQALAERDQKLQEEERRLKLEQERLAKERRDLEASQKKLRDETARAHHMVKEVIARRAELSAMVTRAADERFITLLEEKEKAQLSQALKEGIKDDFRLIWSLVPDEVERTRDELKKLVSSGE